MNAALTPPCRCEGPGKCSRYPLLFPDGLEGGLYALCRGKGALDPASAVCRLVWDTEEAKLRDGEQPKIETPAVRRPCSLLGVELEERGCPSCTGTVSVKVFACPIHSKCSVARDVGAKVCQKCEDHTALREV